MQAGDWFFLPQRGTLSDLYIPADIHLPEKSDFRGISAQFLNVTPLGTAYQNIQVNPAFNAWAMAGINSLGGTFGFQVQIWHVGQAGQRQLFSVSLSSISTVGIGQNPLFLTETELFLPNDSVRIQVKNLSTTQSDNIWIVLWGGDVTVKQ